MGDLIPKEVLEQKRRERKYGKAGQRLKGLGLPLDFNPFERGEWLEPPAGPVPVEDGDRSTAPSDCED